MKRTLKNTYNLIPNMPNSKAKGAFFFLRASLRGVLLKKS
jgi:hypothetical protein